MEAFVRRELSRERCADMTIDAATLETIRRVRAEIRVEEGGGGMCHLVTEWLNGDHGLGRLGVTYLDRTGEVVISGHYVNLLADGSILDPTADQTGEGHDVRLLRPGDPEYGRYRPEFDEEYHPGACPELDAWLPFWSGESDYLRQDKVTRERGKGWWVEDPGALLDYYSGQANIADPEYRKTMQAWIDDIVSRHPGIGGEPAGGPPPF
jgi:hypothetical protein